MQSNNPIFRRSEEFNRAGGSAGYGQMSDPSTWGTGTPGLPTQQVDTRPMTIDSVVQRTGISLAVVIVTAAITWIALPNPVDSGTSDLGSLYAALMIGSLGAFALSMVNSFKRVISPPLVLAFCALEGVALGALSMVFNAMYEGVVINAVIGTFFAFGATLAVYKFANIKVTDKFRTGVMAAVLGMVGLSVVSFVLSMFGVNTGIFGAGPLGAIVAVAGLVLGVFMLILDFDFVEQGIANRLPERESWRAAFAMTVSLVWIYTNLLRLLSILQQD